MISKVLLSIPEVLLRELKEEKEKYAYSSVQEVVMDTLRDKFLKNKKSGKGRKRFSEERVLFRKKVFGKERVK